MAWIRYVAYFVAITFITWALVGLEVASPGSLKFYVLLDETDVYGTSEFSPVEIIQAIILVACGIIMAWVTRCCPSQRPIAFPFGGMALAFLVRELDYFLDRYIIENLWHVPIAIIGALLIVYTYRHRRRLRIALARIWPSPGLTLLFSGAVILFGFARLVGQEALWMSLLGGHYRPIATLAIEEFIELCGYFLWMIGTIEYALQARAIAYREPQPAARRRREKRRHDTERPF
jgi:hypothetical protein